MRSTTTQRKRTWRGRALAGVAAIAAILFVREAKAFLLPIFFATALMFALVGPVRRLQRWGLPEPAGAGVVLVGLLVFAGVLASMLVDPAANWLQRAPTTLQQVIEQVDRVRASIPVIAPPRRARPGAAASGDPVKEKIASEGISLTGRVLGQTLTFSFLAAATVILLYFLLASEQWLLSRTLEALPRRRSKALVLGGLRSAQRDIALYLSTMAWINLGLGVTTAAAMVALGLPNPTLWGTVAGVLNFIPYFGPMMTTLMLLMAGIIGMPDQGLKVTLPALAFLGLHALESNFVSPIVVGRRLAISPLSAFLSVLFWGWLWGVPGAMLAVPILLMVRAACRRHPRGHWVCLFLEGHRVPAGPWRP